MTAGWFEGEALHSVSLHHTRALTLCSAALSCLQHCTRRCDTLRLGVRELKRGIAKIKRDILEPYSAAADYASQLANMTAAQHALKALLKFTAALKRLQAQDMDALSGTARKLLHSGSSSSSTTAGVHMNNICYNGANSLYSSRRRLDAARIS